MIIIIMIDAQMSHNIDGRLELLLEQLASNKPNLEAVKF